MNDYRTVTVTRFKPSGKFYDHQSWRVPRKHVTDDDGETREITLITDVIDSPDTARLDGGAILVPSEPEFDSDENFGFPHLFP